MSSTYEFHMTDDAGKRFAVLRDIAFFSYSRPVSGMGTFQIGIPYQSFIDQVFPIFEPDRRIEIWRSPGFGISLRREGTYLLRRCNIYTRKTDNVQMIVLYGRDMKDLLRRRWIIQPAGYSQTLKEDYVDDMMKEIVREQMLYGSALDVDAVSDNTRAYPQTEFSVQGEFSLGPYLPATFADRNVLDTLKELQDATLQLYDTDPLSYRRIYFDIIPNSTQQRATYILAEDESLILAENGDGIVEEASPVYFDTTIHGLQFVTYAGLRGMDRTLDALVFSVENGNITEPHLTITHMEEENAVIVKGFGRGDSRAWDQVLDTDRINRSRWNRCEAFVDASTEPDQDRLSDYAYPKLRENAPKEELECTFLNSPGSDNSPRSLYGVDWDMGDLLPVFYAGKTYNVEVAIVYVSMDEEGIETITGRNNIMAGDQ